MTSRLLATLVIALVASCSNDEKSQTVCWLASEWPAPPESTGSDSLDDKAWLAHWRRSFLHCAEDKAYQVIQLGDGGELAKATALKDCSHLLDTYKGASALYQRSLEPSATDEALQKFTNADVEELLNDLSTQIEVFKLCHAKGIKSPSWN